MNYKKAVIFKEFSQLKYIMSLRGKLIARSRGNLGAMFGLDARIALAIFGALSVITGASLYSVLENAEATKVITEMNEVAKAYSQYKLDTRKYVPQYPSNKSLLFVPYLVEDKGISKWKGPYLSYKSHSTDFNALLRKDGTKGVWLRVGSIDSAWGGGDDIPSYSGTCPNKPCGLWVQMTVDTDDIADLIDKKVDGVKGRTTGRLRIRNTGVASSTSPNVFMLFEPSHYD